MSDSSTSERPAPTLALGLRAAILWTFGGQVVYAAAQWVMVALLARLGSPQDVGLYALGLSLTSPLFLMLGLQLRSVQATDARQSYPFSQYVSLRLVCMLIALTLTAGLGLLYPQARAILWWLGLAKALEGLSDVCYGMMQQRERLDIVARSTIFRGLLGLGLLAAGYAISHQVALGAAGIALGNLLVFLGYDFPQTRKLEAAPYLMKRLALPLFKLAFPLGLVVGMVSLSSTIPRLVVEHVLGARQLGIYSALVYVNVAGSVVVVAIGTALTARLSQRYAAGDRAGFIRLTGQLTAAAGVVGVGLTLLAWTAGRPLLGLLYGPVYAAQTPAFVWLMASGALAYLASCAGFAVTAARRFIQQLPLFAVVSTVLFFSCQWLVPQQGLVGAALATLIAAGVQLVGSWLIVVSALRTAILPASDPTNDTNTTS